ncbi:hypothetical protein AMELA_G00232980 [Ameiurus melas]|uniref:RRM domain-containing protein n=1 Tax=Ameiurus melas TaxID=219545 RepID=A0A7J5ZXE9_AMEME|nr:hypothetical protein AMELA_G00232980 [Ameiurus melas]
MFKSQKILQFPPYFYRSSHPAMPPHFYPTPSMMEMKHHSSIPSVQQQYPPATPAGFYPHDGYMCNGVYYPTPRPPQYTWPLLAKKERALCEDEGVQDGSIITPQAPATDVLTLDEQVPPVYTLWAVPDLEPQPTSDLPLDQSSHAISKAFLSTHPTPSSLTLAEIMGAEKAEPSTPPTPTPLTGGEIMDGKEADPYKVPPPTPLTLGEIKEQTVDIDEIVKSIRKWLKDQVMKDKTKKFPMDKSHHSNYTKCEDEGVQDGSIITPQAPATDVLTLDEQVPPVYTLWAVPDLEPQLTSDLPPDQSSHAISEASIYTPPTPSSLTLSEIMEAEPSTSPTLSALALAEIMRAEEAEPSTPPAPTPLTGGEILDGKEAEPYKVPPPTPLTLGEIKEQTVDIDEIVKSIRKWLKDQVMKDKTKKFPMDKSYHCRYTKCEDEGVQDGSIITPQAPATDVLTLGGEILDGKEAEPYKVPPPTPLTLGEIKEQTVDIDEIVKSIRKWLKDQVMKDKTKKFPMDKFHHSNYTKCEDEGVQDGSIITPQAPATDVLTLDEQVPPVYTLWAVPDLEPQPTNYLPPDQSSHAISEASLYTPPTPSSLTLSEIMEAEESEPSTPPTPSSFTEQTVDIDEIVKSISEWIKDQVMKDKTKKFPMNKSHHSKYTKRVQLFIKSLDYSVDDKRLHKEFLPFGAVVSAKVVMENGRSKGFGYVSYSSINEAMEAIKGMNGKMLGRRPIHVALSNCREEYKPQLTWTEQKTGSSRPTNPWQSPLKDTQRVQSQSLRRVWIVGDSYVRRSEARARETMGANLGVASQVEWFCRGGMCWGELLYFFKQCLEGRTAPDVLVIHCGGNDLGRVERVLLLRTMKRDLFELHRQFPQMKILFSSINQRRQWQHGLPGKVEKVRTFVNNEMATFVSYINGSFVPHPHILFNKPELYLRDGVHLSPKGHDIFLTGIVQCLRDLSP